MLLASNPFFPVALYPLGNASPPTNTPSILTLISTTSKEEKSYNRTGAIAARGGNWYLAAALVRVIADALALSDLHAGLGVVGRRSTHALLDLAGHGEEGLLDVAGILCGRL